MPARRCPECEIHFPADTAWQECPICEHATIWTVGKQPDLDWRSKLQTAEEPPEDKVLKHRREWLERAGYEPQTALTLSSRRDIDLHDAVELAGRAGPDLAARILL